MLEIISQPWHWSISGFAITLIMFFLLWFGAEFGVSGNLRTICSFMGAGKRAPFFKFNWKGQLWNLVFVVGVVIGGFISSNYLVSNEPVQVSENTVEYLSTLGIEKPVTIEEGLGYVPAEIFNNPFKPVNLILIIGGGFFIGFGARYAGGCTSGHAISGLSNLQLPSLITVVGFFIGGLIMAWLVLPFLLTV